MRLLLWMREEIQFINPNFLLARCARQLASKTISSSLPHRKILLLAALAPSSKLSLALALLTQTCSMLAVTREKAKKSTFFLFCHCQSQLKKKGKNHAWIWYPTFCLFIAFFWIFFCNSLINHFLDMTTIFWNNQMRTLPPPEHKIQYLIVQNFIFFCNFWQKLFTST